MKASTRSITIKVPRPMNCFMTYRLEKQSEIVKKCPGANHRDISKIIAKWWKEMTPEEKEPYRHRADVQKQQHRLKYPEYKFTPKKKLTKTRAYKKRPDNEFAARDYENKQQLLALYHERKKISASRPYDNINSNSNDVKAVTITCSVDESKHLSLLSHHRQNTPNNSGFVFDSNYASNCSPPLKYEAFDTTVTTDDSSNSSIAFNTRVLYQTSTPPDCYGSSPPAATPSPYSMPSHYSPSPTQYDGVSNADIIEPFNHFNNNLYRNKHYDYRYFGMGGNTMMNTATANALHQHSLYPYYETNSRLLVTMPYQQDSSIVFTPASVNSHSQQPQSLHTTTPNVISESAVGTGTFDHSCSHFKHHPGYHSGVPHSLLTEAYYFQPS